MDKICISIDKNLIYLRKLVALSQTQSINEANIVLPCLFVVSTTHILLKHFTRDVTRRIHILDGALFNHCYYFLGPRQTTKYNRCAHHKRYINLFFILIFFTRRIKLFIDDFSQNAYNNAVQQVLLTMASKTVSHLPRFFATKVTFFS